VANEKYRSTEITGNYAELAKALDGYGKKVTRPGDIVPAITRRIQNLGKRTLALLEFISAKEIQYSV